MHVYVKVLACTYLRTCMHACMCACMNACMHECMHTSCSYLSLRHPNQAKPTNEQANFNVFQQCSQKCFQNPEVFRQYSKSVPKVSHRCSKSEKCSKSVPKSAKKYSKTFQSVPKVFQKSSERAPKNSGRKLENLEHIVNAFQECFQHTFWNVFSIETQI